jgi:hypothetical protein
MKRRLVWMLFLCVVARGLSAQTSDDAALFRRGNEHAARSRFDDAIADYEQLQGRGVSSPALYWNWAQAAAGAGRNGESLWAQLRAQDLAPPDRTTIDEVERLRLELGLDRSEISRGFAGDARLLARRFHLPLFAIVTFLISGGLAIGRRENRSISFSVFAVGLLLIAPGLLGMLREPRGVVVKKEGQLLDIPRGDAVALATLREGEVVPILAVEGDYFKIQDASGARGFAHRNDVRPLENPSR